MFLFKYVRYNTLKIRGYFGSLDLAEKARQ